MFIYRSNIHVTTDIQRTAIYVNGVLKFENKSDFHVSIDTTSEKMGSLDELTAYVSSELQKDLTRPVVVQGDAQVPYDNVIQLMNALKKSGVKSVGLVTEPVSN